jgi:hypothetical protein
MRESLSNDLSSKVFTKIRQNTYKKFQKYSYFITKMELLYDRGTTFTKNFWSIQKTILLKTSNIGTHSKQVFYTKIDEVFGLQHIR